MHYKTIMQAIFADHADTEQVLKAERLLLPAINYYAMELRNRHLFLKDQFQAGNPPTDPISASSQAMDMAQAEMRERLFPADSAEDPALRILAETREYVRRHMPPAS